MGRWYELAHERLIPALRQVANRELTDANKANLLLDRRVNEWLGSGKSRRYLFSLKELGLLRQQRGFLEWGQQRSQKEALVKKSWNRMRLRGSSIGVPLVMGLAFVVWSNTPPGQIQWTRWDLIGISNAGFLRDSSGNGEILNTVLNMDMLSGVSHQPFPVELFVLESSNLDQIPRIIQMIGKFKNRDSAKQLLRQIEWVISRYPDEKKSELLSQLSVVWVDLEEIEYSRKLLDAANIIIPSIKDEYVQSTALSSIAEAYGKLGDAEKGKQVLGEALELTKSSKEVSIK